MPASRVTSASPWHVVLVGFAQPGKKEAVAAVTDALDFMIEEMSLISGGGKPMFRVSVIDACREQPVVAISARDFEAAELLASSKPARRPKSPVRLSALLETARKILEENPGRHQDFTPWVIVMSASPADDASAAAHAVKTLDIAAGAPCLAVFDLLKTQNPNLKAIVSDPALYRSIASPHAVAVALPGLAPIGGSARADVGTPNGKALRTI